MRLASTGSSVRCAQPSGFRAGDLHHEAVGIVEVDPMPLPAVLDPGRVELADDLVGVEILDGVGVVAQAGVVIPEQGEEAVVVAPAQDPEEVPLLVDDLEAEVGPVELGGPLQVADVQGDVIQALRLEGRLPVLAGAGGLRDDGHRRPQAHQPGDELTAGELALLELLDDLVGEFRSHGLDSLERG